MSSWEEWKRNKRGELAAKNLDKQLHDALRKSVTVKVCPECEQRSKWMPVETAPYDTPVQVFQPSLRLGRFTGVGIGIRMSQPVVDWLEWDASCCGVSMMKPTHWMPLPEPPQEKADE